MSRRCDALVRRGEGCSCARVKCPPRLELFKNVSQRTVVHGPQGVRLVHHGRMAQTDPNFQGFQSWLQVDPSAAGARDGTSAHGEKLPVGGEHQAVADGKDYLLPGGKPDGRPEPESV